MTKSSRIRTIDHQIRSRPASRSESENEVMLASHTTPNLGNTGERRLQSRANCDGSRLLDLGIPVKEFSL